MPEEKKGDIITPIRLEDAAKKYSVTPTTLREWGRLGVIVMTRRIGVLLFDDNSIKSYFDLQDKLKEHEEYLEKMLTEKEKEVSDTIAVYDDYLFSMRSLERTLKIFPVIINELALIINDEKTRDIFLHITLGKDIYRIARKYSLTYDRACAIYVHAINVIEKRSGLIIKYKNRIVELGKKVRTLELANNNLKDHIARLEKIKGVSLEIRELSNVPDNALYLLSLNIRENFNIEQRITNCLQSIEIYTVEDLLRYIYNHDGDINSLLKIESFGPICLRRLKIALQKHQIIDANGYSQLLELLAQI